MSDPIAFASATELLAMMEQGELSSRQLLEIYIGRVEAFNPKINAVVAQDLDAARQRADEADAARARGELWGPLHGLPMTIKDTYEVAGMPCVAGAVKYKSYMPGRHAAPVQRLIDAGAIIFGKTNVPYLAGNLQSYNRVYGTTNNPWDLTRAPGGSSGGAAAAVAAGLTAAELGSDIGGSIRTPSHYCGVFGHKATHGAIDMTGHIPAEPGTVTQFDLQSAGPIARSPEDLELLTRVLTGIGGLVHGATDLRSRRARGAKVKGLRILAWLDDPLCPIEAQLLHSYRSLLARLQCEGAVVTEGAPFGLSLATYFPLYLNLLSSVLSVSLPKHLRVLMRLLAPLYKVAGPVIGLPLYFDHYLRGGGQSHVSWLRHHEQREKLRLRLPDLFARFDLVLAPVVPMTAIKHQQLMPLPLRRVRINGESRHYTDHLKWVSFATLLGLPATSAPVGRDAAGLPFNVQVIGPPHKDIETIRYASLIAAVADGFSVPTSWRQSA
ncbi:MAG: amidase [Deltaproteobacteria bacterium]|nr:amidase [Deltaproteobacteria bacterium]